MNLDDSFGDATVRLTGAFVSGPFVWKVHEGRRANSILSRGPFHWLRWRNCLDAYATCIRRWVGIRTEYELRHDIQYIRIRGQ
jgi:hypothetical protein